MSELVAAPVIDRLVAQLRSSLQADQFRIDERARFSVDGRTPDLVIEPADADELQRSLEMAQAAGLAVIPVGGGQHLALGNSPSSYDVAVSMRRLSRIVAHEPADMTVTVQPGAPLAELNHELGQHGQMLPLDPPVGPEATVGGVLAANAFGPLRHAFGTARDWLIGLQVVHADGSRSKAGGRVVKNVTGYDLHKLYVGSLGSLGVVVEATFKLAPTPHASSTVVAEFDAARDASAVVLDARQAGLAVHAAEVLSPAAAEAVCGSARWTLLMRVAGGAAAVDRSMRDLRRFAGDARLADRDGGPRWAAWSRAFQPDALALRLTLLPSSVAPAIESLDRVLAGDALRLSATVAAGVVRMRLTPASGEASALARVREIAARHDATLLVEAASPDLKRDIDVFGPARPDFEIMRRLKSEFDPKGTLAPGRFVGRL